MTAHPAGPLDDQLVTDLRDLCQWIEEIAIGWQDPEELVRLLDLSAHVLFIAEDHRFAARFWMRALEINRTHASERPRAIALRASILESLSWLYHHTQRPLKALEVEHELVSLHLAAEPTPATANDLANAQARLGATLAATDQFDTAREHLTQADHAFQALGTPTPGMARTHAHVLNLLATVHRHQRQPAKAHRCETRAIEVAALPLVPAAYVIYELNTTLTTAIDQLTTLARQVTPVVDAIGDEGQPRPAGLAQLPGVVAAWYDLASTVDNLGSRLRSQVHAIASAAGDDIAGPRRPTLLDKLAELTEWTAYEARTRGESTRLIELRDRAARIFRQAQDFRRAQAQWQRALEHADLLACTPDAPAAATARATAIRILESQRDLSHAHNRLDDAIDVETQLLNRFRHARDQPGTAHALTRLGATMVAKKDYDRAEAYLTEADATFQAIDPRDLAIACSHADTRELLATVLIHQGRQAEATQRRHQAEALRTTTPHLPASHDHLD